MILLYVQFDESDDIPLATLHNLESANKKKTQISKRNSERNVFFFGGYFYQDLYLNKRMCWSPYKLSKNIAKQHKAK